MIAGLYGGRSSSAKLRRTLRSWRCGSEGCEIEERCLNTTVEFRINGSIARLWLQNPDGSEWTSTYEYSYIDLLKNVRNASESGIVSNQTYEYDAEGRLSRILERSNGGVDRVTESFEHYASCRTKKRVHIDLDKQQPDTSYGWGVEGTDSMYSVRGATTVTTLYNEGRQPTDMLFHDGADNLLSRVELIYDKAGNLVEEAQTNVAETLRPKTLASLSEEQLKAVLAVFGAGGEPIRRLHKYDHQGRRIETLSGIPSLGANYQTFAYNEFEDKSEEILEQEDREYEIDDQGQLSASPDKHLVSRTEFRFSYEYDAWGNWLRKTVKSHSGADQDFTLSSTEERTLEYFA